MEEELEGDGQEEGREGDRGLETESAVVADSDRDLERASFLDVDGGDEGELVLVVRTLRDDDIGGITGRGKERDDLFLARDRTGTTGVDLKVDDVVVKVVETGAVSDPPLVEQEHLLVTTKALDLGRLVGEGGGVGVLDGEVDDDGAGRDLDGVDLRDLGIDEVGDLTGPVVETEVGEDTSDTHDTSDRVVREAASGALGGVLAGRAARAGSVTTVREGVGGADGALLEELRPGLSILAEVDTETTGGRGLAKAAGVAAGRASDGGEASRTAHAEASAEGEGSVGAASAATTAERRLTSSARDARSTGFAAGSSGTVGAETSRERRLTGGTLGADASLDGREAETARRAETRDRGGVSRSRGAVFAKTSRAGGGSRLALCASTSLDGRETSSAGDAGSALEVGGEARRARNADSSTLIGGDLTLETELAGCSIGGEGTS